MVKRKSFQFGIWRIDIISCSGGSPRIHFVKQDGTEIIFYKDDTNIYKSNVNSPHIDRIVYEEQEVQEVARQSNNVRNLRVQPDVNPDDTR